MAGQLLLTDYFRRSH